MHQIRFRLQHCHIPHWGSLQCTHRAPSWSLGILPLRGKKAEKDKKRKKEQMRKNNEDK